MAEQVETNQIGEIVSRLRRGSGLSQAQLAQAAGISQTTIDKIERGETKRSKYLPEIAKALQVPVGMLVDQREPIAVETLGPNSSEPSVDAIAFREKFPEYLPLYPTFDVFESFRGKDDPVSQMFPFIVGKVALQMAERPKMIALDSSAYSIYVPDESMFPEFSAGDVIIVSPSHPIVSNTSCIFYGKFADIECAMIARLNSVQDEFWTVRKWNLDVAKQTGRASWSACHRIVARLIR